MVGDGIVVLVNQQTGGNYVSLKPEADYTKRQACSHHVVDNGVAIQGIQKNRRNIILNKQPNNTI